MREIKFRGMTIHGEWVHGFVHVVPRVPSKYQRVEAGTYISNSAGSPFAYQVRSETVGQFTGLCDKNGVEIYEGDVVEIRHPKVRNLQEEGTERGEIAFNEERGQFAWKEPESGVLYGLTTEDSANEVIGNIYELPELIGGATHA